MVYYITFRTHTRPVDDSSTHLHINLYTLVSPTEQSLDENIM